MLNLCAENGSHHWNNESLYGNIMLGEVPLREPDKRLTERERKVDDKESIKEAEGRRGSHRNGEEGARETERKRGQIKAVFLAFRSS